MITYSNHGVLEPVSPEGWPRPRSTNATVAATLMPSASSQITAHAVIRARSTVSGDPEIRLLSGPSARESSYPCHQQLVCAELLAFDDNTVPSLVVIEQFSLLTRNRLDACTEPTSDCEIGVTVSDHGM